MNHKDDKLNYFSKLDDIKLMYVLKLLYGGREGFDESHILYTYDNTEILTHHMGSNKFKTSDYWDSIVTLLTTKEYRSFNISIVSYDNDLSESDVKYIFSSLSSAIK